MDAEIIICSCGCVEHQIIVHKDDNFDNNYKEVIFTSHLSTYRNIFQRIAIAFKYVLGKKCKYGQWDSVIITRENYLPLKNAVEFLEDK